MKNKCGISTEGTQERSGGNSTFLFCPDCSTSLKDSFAHKNLQALTAEFSNGCADGGTMLRGDAQLVEVKHGECVGLAKVFLRNRTENHADAGGVVRDGVDENERAGGFVVFIGIKEDFLGGEQRGASNLVEFKMVVDNSQTTPTASAKNLSSTISNVAGLVDNQSASVLNLAVAGDYDTKNAGTGKTITYGVTFNNSNYQFRTKTDSSTTPATVTSYDGKGTLDGSTQTHSTSYYRIAHGRT